MTRRLEVLVTRAPFELIVRFGRWQPAGDAETDEKPEPEQHPHPDLHAETESTWQPRMIGFVAEPGSIE